MKGYIIKNCPKAVSFPSETKCEGTGKYCLEVPTEKCLIKQIIKECEKSVNAYNNQEFFDDDADIFLGESLLGQRILYLIKAERIE